jgi:transmembrane sensor
MDERLLDEALAWQRALAGDDADWDAFTLWLEADPRHRQAFDEIALTERLVEERKDGLRQLVEAAPPAPPRKRIRRQRLFAGAIAAAIALAVGVPTLWPRPGADMVYVTRAGETRDIALAGGTAIDLAPASRLIVKASDPSSLELARGEAYFAVVHDPRRTLSIRAGNFAVTDIGTKFGLNLTGDLLTIGVSEGHVTVTGEDGAATRISAGEQLIARSDGQPVHKTPIAAKDVGSWRLGRLVYNDAPLSIVAADISRYSGKTVVVDPSLRDRRFSGVLAIGDGSGLLGNLADLMALSYRMEGDRVRISTADGH